METSARIAIARTLAQRLQAHFGSHLLLAGVYGSAARGDDTPWSDLDMFVVGQAEMRFSERTYLIRSMPVHLEYVSEPELRAALDGPTLRWPYLMGVLDTVQPLAGAAGLATAWRERGQAPAEAAFRTALERALPGLVFESYGRIRSCGARNNWQDASHAASEVLYEIKTALCLLNRRWVTRDYYAGFVESFAFPLRPANYELLVPQLWEARELNTIVTVAGELVSAYWRLLTTCGLNVPNHQTVESVPLEER
jgi:kanamycin nucleotidyltransferase